MIEIKKLSYVLILAAFISAAALIFLGKEKLDTSLKPVIEGLSISLVAISFIALVLLFKKDTFKNALLFEIVNIILCILAITSLVIYLREDNIDKNNSENIVFLSILSLAIFLSSMFLFNDIYNLNIGSEKKLKL